MVGMVLVVLVARTSSQGILGGAVVDLSRARPDLRVTSVKMLVECVPHVAG